MEEKERDGSGRFSRSVDDADVLGAVRAHDPASTSEIAEEVGISRQGADRRLRSLREDGAVSSKKIGASLVWFIPRERAGGTDGFDAGDLRGDPSTTLDDTDAEQDGATAGGPNATEPPAEDRNAESGRTRDESDAVDPVDHDELPDGVDVADAREAYDAVRSHLREQGPAGKQSIVTAVMVDHALGYDVPELEPGDRYRGAWWRRVIRPALAADPDVTHRENHGDYDL